SSWVMFTWCRGLSFFLFFFPHPATPWIYTLSLHDALPISDRDRGALECASRHDLRPCGDSPLTGRPQSSPPYPYGLQDERPHGTDRKSTRLNSSHVKISYAVFCLKKKKKENRQHTRNRDRY